MYSFTQFKKFYCIQNIKNVSKNTQWNSFSCENYPKTISIKFILFLLLSLKLEILLHSLLTGVNINTVTFNVLNWKKSE